MEERGLRARKLRSAALPAALALALAVLILRSAAQEGAALEAIELPPAVEAAVLKERPQATIAKMTVETMDGINLYDIEFDEDDGEMEVAEDGTIIDISTVVVMEELPPAAAEAIRRAAGEAEIVWVERSEVRAEVQMEGGKARLVPLATYKYVYEAELVQGKRNGEVEVTAEGEVLEGVKWDGDVAKEEEGSGGGQ